MSDKVEYSRLLLKRSNISGVVPTIPPTSATTLNQFTPTDLFVGEMFANVEDDKLWIRTNNDIIELNVSGSTGTTTPTLREVLFEGNATLGEDIIVSNGDTVVFAGLSSGATTQFLGLDADGNTIIVTGATGGSGTSGTSGVDGTSGTSGVNGTSGTSGIDGTKGADGTSGTSGVNGSTGSSGTSGVDGTSGTDGLGLSAKSGSVTGNSGYSGNSYNVVFAQPFGSTAYTISTMYSPNYPSNPLVVDSLDQVSNISVSGFTFRGWDAPTSNAFLEWSAIAHGETGVPGTSGTSGIDGSSGTSGVNGTSGVDGSSGTSGILVGDYLPLSGGTVTGNTTFTENVYLTNLTSGGSSTYLTVDSDTGQIYTALGAAGSSGTSGVNGTSGTSGTSGGGGGGGLPGVHFNYPLNGSKVQEVLSLTGGYQAVAWSPWAMRVFAYPVIPAQDVTFSGVSLDQYNAAAGGEFAFALYDDNDNKPGNLIFSSTTISSATGYAIKQYNYDYTLSAGTRYWLGMGQNGTSSGSTIISTGYQMAGLFTIGTITTSDGYGVNYKYAVSNVMPYWPYFPSTFDMGATFGFNGGWVVNGYYGGTNVAPGLRFVLAK